MKSAWQLPCGFFYVIVIAGLLLSHSCNLSFKVELFCFYRLLVWRVHFHSAHFGRGRIG